MAQAAGHGAIRVTFTSDPDLLLRAFEFRYRIYVEEMRRVQHHADHARRRIIDPLDACGHNMVALDGDEIVGVGRVNFATDGPLGAYEEFYGMARMGDDHPARTSISTRLMIVPDLRGSLLAARFAVAAYALGLRRGMRWNFLDCNDHLVPFFAGLGYQSHQGRVEHPEYGFVNSLVLDLHDGARLAALRSPLLRAHREHFAAEEAAAADDATRRSAERPFENGLARRG
jgi:hypothetical protein